MAFRRLDLTTPLHVLDAVARSELYPAKLKENEMKHITLTVQDTGERSYEVGDGAKFAMPALPERLEKAEPVQMFNVSLDYLDRLIERTQEITGDQNLSSTGKENLLHPVRAESVQRIAAGVEMINRYEVQLNANEQAMLALPTLHDQAAAVAIEDREIRDFWRSQPLSERAKMLAQMQDDPLGNERLMIATLRSPIPVMLDAEKSLMRQIWSDTKRAANPALAASIEDGRQAIEWARRGCAHAAGMTKLHTTWTNDKVRQALMNGQNELAPHGAGVFG